MDSYLHTPTRLTVDVEQSSEGNFVAQVQELPGCVTFAPTFEELASQIDMAIKGILDLLRKTDPVAYDRLMARSTPLPTDWHVAQPDAPIPTAA